MVDHVVDRGREPLRITCRDVGERCKPQLVQPELPIGPGVDDAVGTQHCLDGEDVDVVVEVDRRHRRAPIRRIRHERVGELGVLGLSRPAGCRRLDDGHGQFLEGRTLPVGAEHAESGRLEFAKWVSADENAVTARVYANRVWSWLMGRGIVATPNNFGTTGAAPTHPDLLDWLASELVRSGWSTKHIHKLIMTSSVYMQNDAFDEHRATVDRTNSLHWRRTSPGRN